jgi:CRP-like cAMP-binding protein
VFDQQLLLAALTEREFRHWLEQGQIERLNSGETLIEADDFPDLYLILEGRFLVQPRELPPGILGLDEFLTGWMTDREWMADSPMTLLRLDSGRFGQILATDPKRRYQFHQAMLPVLSARLYRQLHRTPNWPIAVTRGLERGVTRFAQLKRRLL